VTHITYNTAVAADVSRAGESTEQTIASESEGMERKGKRKSASALIEKKAKKEISMQRSVEWRTYVCAWSASKQTNTSTHTHTHTSAGDRLLTYLNMSESVSSGKRERE